MISYPARYCDKYGEEEIIIQNDGKMLRMIVRGVEFTGTTFHSFEPIESSKESEIGSFSLFLGELCAYTLDCDIPVIILDRDNALLTTLRAHIERGKPVEGAGGTSIRHKDGSVEKNSRQIECEVLQLEVIHQAKSFKTSGRNECYSFEEQLDELKDLLPTDSYLKICWNCAFSDYSPMGNDVFGDLDCYRDNKRQYLRVRSKRDLFQVPSTMSVQEIHLCSEFRKRKPGTGYRG